MEERFTELKTRLAEIHDLRRSLELLFWDQTVMMPPGGGPRQGQQLTTLDRIAHETFVADEIGTLLDELADYEQQLDYDSDEASLIRTTRRDYDKARRVPPELAAEMTGAAAEAHDVWAKAREENDFELFLPHLERAVELKRRYIDCFDGYDEPYDVLLDDFEPGMKTAEVRAVFDELKAELVPLIAEIGSVEGDDAFMSGPWPIDAQHAYSLEIIKRFGFDESFARLDLTVHPFAASSGTQDIRLTTRYKEDDITSIFTAMHECGHGLYEHGVSSSLERTPLCHGVSSALHESQSRMWENIVGRSREFWNYFYPSFQERFPEAIGDVDPGALLPRDQPRQAVPRPRRRGRGDLQPAHHSALRAGAGDLRGHDRPRRPAGEWNRRFEEYLGIPVPTDTLGVLQDDALVGRKASATSCSLGNIVSVQIWRVLRSCPTCRSSSSRASSGSCTSGCRPACTLGRKFTRRRLSTRVGGPVLGAGLRALPKDKRARSRHRSVAERVDTIVVGGGQAGLSTSWHLTRRGVEHAVLERGRVGQVAAGALGQLRPQHAKLGPAAARVRLCRPGAGCVRAARRGDRLPRGLRRVVRCTGARGRLGDSVEGEAGRRLRAGHGRRRRAHGSVVVATGAYQRPTPSPLRDAAPPGVFQQHTAEYRNRPSSRMAPSSSSAGGQSGCQVAEDLLDAGRAVYLSVGACPWVPRRHRGRDLVYWMAETGMLDQTVDTLTAPNALVACNPL